jgi:hypothetical protein
MEIWRKVWREAVAPLLSLEAIAALAGGLARDDARLLQGQTAAGYPEEAPCRAACALGYCGWQGDGLETVAEVEEFFGQLCARINERYQEDPAACRWFLNWFDETPREEMRQELLAEVRLELERRAGQVAA